jgi:Polyphosphate kinase 2 (PPK2)
VSREYCSVGSVRSTTESTTSDNGIKVVKLFLNLSKEEQRTRFLRRIDLPDDNWKFSSADVREREYWDEYQKAFSEMLTNTSTEWAPWYVIPADRKWYARIAAGAVIANTLIDIYPRYPTIDSAAQEKLQEIKKTLEAQAPPGAAADPFAASLAGETEVAAAEGAPIDREKL